MKYKLATAMLAVTAMVVATLTATTVTTTRPAHAAAADPGTWPIDQWGTPQPTDDAVLKWDEQLLSAIRAYPKQTGPTVASRAFGVLFTAIYDAWAAYDPVAKVTQNGGPSQQTTGNTDANKTEAISYAAYRTLNDLFPPTTFPSCSPATTPCPFPGATYQTPDVLLQQQGFDPSNTTPASPTDTAATPAAVGNLAAQAVLDFRHNDGSNQLNGYADTTGYQPVNTWNQVNDRWRWQPLCVPLPPPGTRAASCPGTVQKALTPQWGKVIPFSAPVTTYYLPGPPKNPDGSYSTADITQALQDTSNLTDTQKVTAEYWADGPGTAFPPGHMMLFAEALSRKNHFSLDTDVKLFFTLGNAEMDAGIACWYYKYKYDFVRPITAIREQYQNQYITSWLGPNQGYGHGPGPELDSLPAAQRGHADVPRVPVGPLHLHRSRGDHPGRVHRQRHLRCDRHHPRALLEVRVEHPRPGNNPVVSDVLGRVQLRRHVAPLRRHPLRERRLRRPGAGPAGRPVRLGYRPELHQRVPRQARVVR